MRFLPILALTAAFAAATTVSSFSCSVEEQSTTVTTSGPDSCSAAGNYGVVLVPSATASIVDTPVELGTSPVTSFSNSIEVSTLANGGATFSEYVLNLEAGATADVSWTQTVDTGVPVQLGYIDLTLNVFNDTPWAVVSAMAEVGPYTTANCFGGCILPFELGEPFTLGLTLDTTMLSGFPGGDQFQTGGGLSGVSLSFSLYQADGTPVSFYDPPANTPELNPLVMLGSGLLLLGFTKWRQSR